MSKLFIKTRLKNQLNKNLSRKSSINNLELQKTKINGDRKAFTDAFNKRKKLYADWNAKQQAIKDGEKIKITENPIFILRKKGKNILSAKTIDKLTNQRKKIVSEFETREHGTITLMGKISKIISEYKLDLAKKKKVNAPQTEINGLQKRIDANNKLMDLNRISLGKLAKEYSQKITDYDSNVAEIIRRLEAYNFRKGIYKKK